MIQLELHEQVPISRVEQAIAEYDLDPSIIYSGENNTQVVIRLPAFWITSREGSDRAPSVRHSS